MSTDAAKLVSLLKKLKKSVEPAQALGAGVDDPLETLIWSYLLWESSGAKAQRAMRKLDEAFADRNELRIALPSEVHAVIGERYPLAEERCERLYATLHEVYQRQDAVTLAPLLLVGKRDAKKLLQTLDGIPPYVAARTALLGLDGHAVPVDEQLLDKLIDEGIVQEGTTTEQASSQLERAVKAVDGAQTHAILQTWAETNAPAKKKTTAAKKKTAKAKG